MNSYRGIRHLPWDEFMVYGVNRPSVHRLPTPTACHRAKKKLQTVLKKNRTKSPKKHPAFGRTQETHRLFKMAQHGSILTSPLFKEPLPGLWWGGLSCPGPPKASAAGYREQGCGCSKGMEGELDECI